MKSPNLQLLFLAVSATLCGAEEMTAADPLPDLKESPWGRIYLRNGLAPIQYFRDDFGGPLPLHEVSLYFPKRTEDNFGCELLPEPELLEIEAANRSTVLVVDRGECTFERKARLADQMGTAALVVVSPTDDVSSPVAALKNGDEDISIASVMIRRSAGDMLRVVAKQMSIYGRLISMTCERKPYMCKPRYEAEEDYIEASVARGGSIFSVSKDDDGSRLGSFLAAAYGSVLSTKISFPLATLLDGKQACVDATEEITTQSEFSGRVVLIPAGQAGSCSEFEKVSNAQRRGAGVVVLIQQGNTTIMTHPDVKVTWHAYNITIPVLTVSSATGADLVAFRDAQGEAARLRFAVRNGVADAWELLAKHSIRSAWPKRVKRCTKTLATLLRQLRGLGGEYEMEEALKNVFLNVVGGSLKDWETVVLHDEELEDTQEAPASRTQEPIVQSVKKSQTHDEL
ncbi:hypothetical protein P3T76_014909 [Phytophthora citrophthora]|uniref:PA domain-containing protein n=1 Tax=Phytophthora citrophthora TaxID=4793 RepID=A0AAD9LBM2_9STRA|nr:hypothetical protein P3T76_014909 [Phytophthora citrophthora]